MPWHDVYPDGSKSVEDNGPIGTDNTTYIKTTMNIDHFWDDSADNDGRHQFVQCPMQGTAAVPTDPALGTGMDGAAYFKAKLAAEAPDNQDVQPFFINNTDVAVPGVTQVMQLLGMRVCGLFSVAGGAVTEEYIHNVTSITRDAVGQFTVVFPELPTNNYLVFGGALAQTGVALRFSLFPNAVSAKTKTQLKFYTIQDHISSVINYVDPVQAWFVCFGG